MRQRKLPVDAQVEFPRITTYHGLQLVRLELTRFDGHRTSPTLRAEVFNEQTGTEDRRVEGARTPGV
jgi:hypothetical protein